MKRILTALLASAIFVCSAAACGSSSSGEESKGTVSLSSAEESSETESSKEENQKEESSAETESSEATSKEESKESSKETKTESSTASAAEAPAETAVGSKTAESKAAEESKAQSSAKSDTSSSAVSSASETQASYSDSDSAVVYKNVKIEIGKEFKSSSLGTPDSKQENTNCLSGGSGFTYIFGSITVNVYTENNKEYVEGILVDGGSDVSTSAGIKCGSSSSDLEKAYGEPSQKDDFMYTYTAAGTNVMFYLENGKVSGLYMAKNA